MRAMRRCAGRRLPSYDCLVELRGGGDTKPPVFLVCWAGGRLISYRDLVPRLPADQPLYGLRAPRFDGRTHLFSTLEELARLFVAEVRRFQPAGPYLFVGYCFGGTLAHEMVAQLEVQGERTLLLAAIESSPYGHGGPRARRTPMERRRAIVWKFFHSGVIAKLRLVGSHVFGRWGRPRRTIRSLAFALACRTGWRWPDRFCHLNLIAIRRALAGYVAPASNACMTLFEAHDPAHGLEPSVWPKLAGGGVEINAITAPGIGHVSIMHAPYVDELAARLTRSIDETLSARAAPVTA